MQTVSYFMITCSVYINQRKPVEFRKCKRLYGKPLPCWVIMKVGKILPIAQQQALPLAVMLNLHPVKLKIIIMMTISKSLTLSIFVGLNLLAYTNSTAQNINSKTSKKEQVKSSLTSYEKYIDAKNDDHLKEFIELVS